MISLCTVRVFGVAAENTDLDTFDSSDLKTQDYVDGEVLICIEDTPETREISFCSIYSIDYKEINKDINNGFRTNAEPIDSIPQQLNLNIDLLEMRLLNPSSSCDEDGKYRINEKYNSIFLLKIKNESVNKAVNILSENTLIRYAHPNYLLTLETTPNDPLYNAQYALQKINIPQAWNITTGNQDVVVGIVDTGIDGTHADLVDNLWNNPYYVEGTGCSVCNQHNFPYQNDLHGFRFTGSCNGGTPTDTNGHGTKVAGVVGAKGNNSLGVCGTNWNIRLAWLGVCNSDGSVVLEKVISAICYAEAHGIMILNCSFSSTMEMPALSLAIANYSGLVVCAAGNQSTDIDRYHRFPACFENPNILVVAATDSSNNLWSSSNNGINNVDVAAPGTGIYTTSLNGYYSKVDGTSLSTPQVTGIAALIKAAHPNYSSQQIKAAICGTVQQLGKNYNIANDGGIVDAAAAVSVNSNMLKSITYNYNYSNAPSPYIDYVYYGHKPEELTVLPTRSGFVFDGWYTSANTVTPYNFNNSVYSNKTVYAKWVSAPEDSYGDVFPDYRFRKTILDIVNTHDNGSRTAESPTSNDLSFLSSITTLNISNKEIRSIAGIDLLTGLLSLDCSNNRISNILMLNLNMLENLDCSSNCIHVLNYTDSSSLLQFDCSFNSLCSFNPNDNLQRLICNNNYLSSLTTGTNLQYLNCNHNNINKLNVEASTGLETLYCNSNELYVINTEGLSDLENVDVSNNQMNSKNDVIGYMNWNLPSGVFYNVFNPQKPWRRDDCLDVISGTYYYKAVEYVLYHGYMNDELSQFRPDDSLTRLELAVTIYKMAGQPDVSGLSIPFTDVSNIGSDNLNAVKWVYNNGNQSIMNGTSNTLFSPFNSATREMVAVVLDRFATRESITLRKIRDYVMFTDDSQISQWARASIIKLYEAGIINGSSNYYYPNASILRCDTAVVVRKFDVIPQYLQ